MAEINPYNAELLTCKPWKPKGSSQFEIIIIVLVGSFRFIWIPYVYYLSKAIIAILIL